MAMTGTAESKRPIRRSENPQHTAEYRQRFIEPFGLRSEAAGSGNTFERNVALALMAKALRWRGSKRAAQSESTDCRASRRRARSAKQVRHAGRRQRA